MREPLFRATTEHANLDKNQSSDRCLGPWSNDRAERGNDRLQHADRSIHRRIQHPRKKIHRRFISQFFI